jgi:uncharacterized protein (DUF2164 family)
VKKTKRKWDLLSEKEREKAINDLIDFFETEKDEKIGVVAAEEILDTLLQSSATIIYNKAIKDTIDFIRERFEDIAIDSEVNLKK